MTPETREAQRLYREALRRQLEAAEALVTITRLHYEQALREESLPETHLPPSP